MKVELLDTFGSDVTVCDVARVSFDKRAEHYTTEQNNSLLSYLARHSHWSPFSHPKVVFRLQVPIYVERQLIKTQIGVEYNSISGRYVDFSDTYTLINEWRTQSRPRRADPRSAPQSAPQCRNRPDATAPLRDFQIAGPARRFQPSARRNAAVRRKSRQ